MSNNFISGCIPKTIFEMQYLGKRPLCDYVDFIKRFFILLLIHHIFMIMHIIFYEIETLYLDVNAFECELFPEIYNGPALGKKLFFRRLLLQMNEIGIFLLIFFMGLIVDLQMQNNKFYGKLPLVLDHVSKLSKCKN